jgi:hypothetical protein
MATWEGRVDAKNEAPINTGLNFKRGSKITIVASGYARPKDDWHLVGAAGYVRERRNDAPAPDAPIGALIAKTGEIYTFIGCGLINWSPPTDDNLQLLYNDRRGTYHDNEGGFNVQIVYDEDSLLRLS